MDAGAANTYLGLCAPSTNLAYIPSPSELGVQKCIKRAKYSEPGLDGPPYSAWAAHPRGSAALIRSSWRRLEGRSALPDFGAVRGGFVPGGDLQEEMDQ
eukprot:8891995-Pyramimonas_sp.AAC.1